MKRFVGLDWEVAAGITAAVAMLVLHFLPFVGSDALLSVMLLLLALLLFRDLHHEHQQGRITERVERTEAMVMKMQAASHVPAGSEDPSSGEFRTSFVFVALRRTIGNVTNNAS